MYGLLKQMPGKYAVLAVRYRGETDEIYANCVISSRFALVALRGRGASPGDRGDSEYR